MKKMAIQRKNLTCSSRMAIFITQMDDIEHRPCVRGSGGYIPLTHFNSSFPEIRVTRSRWHQQLAIIYGIISIARISLVPRIQPPGFLRSRTNTQTTLLPPGGTMSSNARKVRAIAITVIGVMATNIAISFASGASEKPYTQPKKSEMRTSGAPAFPNPPRPHSDARTSGAPANPNPPRP